MKKTEVTLFTRKEVEVLCEIARAEVLKEVLELAKSCDFLHEFITRLEKAQQQEVKE